MKEVKTKVLGIKITEKDLKKLAEQAEKNKLTTSSYARHLIFRALEAVTHEQH